MEVVHTCWHTGLCESPWFDSPFAVFLWTYTVRHLVVLFASWLCATLCISS